MYISSSIGINLDCTGQGGFLHVSFEEMYSTKFCGSKAADFCGATSNCVAILVSSKDLSETLDGYDQILRRVLKKVAVGASPVQSIVFLVESNGMIAAETAENLISTKVGEIWADLTSEVGELMDTPGVSFSYPHLGLTYIGSFPHTLLSSTRLPYSKCAPRVYLRKSQLVLSPWIPAMFCPFKRHDPA
jgi:hypothetical protein